MTTATPDRSWRLYDAILLASTCIEETARDMAPMGAPSGIVFSVLQQHGMSIEIYHQLLRTMEEAGTIHVINHCIRSGPEPSWSRKARG